MYKHSPISVLVLPSAMRIRIGQVDHGCVGTRCASPPGQRPGPVDHDPCEVPRSVVVAADWADADVGLSSRSAGMHADRDLGAIGAGRPWGGCGMMLSVVGGAAVWVAQQRVGGQDLGQAYWVGRLILGVGMQGADQRSVGRRDVGRRGVAGDAEHSVRIIGLRGML
jgi:hypothetical protein